MIFNFILPLLLSFNSVTPVNDYYKSEIAFNYYCPSCVTIEDTYGDEVYSNNYISLTAELYYKMNDNAIDWYVTNINAYMKMEVYTNNGDDYLPDLDDTFLISDSIFYYNTLQDFLDTCDFTFQFYANTTASVIIFTQDIYVHDEYQEYQGLTFNYTDTRNFTFDTSSLINDINNYVKGQLTGISNDYQNGYTEGYTSGYRDGEATGYQNGFYDGFEDADNQDATAATIFTGILEVGLLPINVFLMIFNYEVFGVNISGLVSALLTVSVVLIIIRVILNKSGGSGGSK